MDGVHNCAPTPMEATCVHAALAISLIQITGLVTVSYKYNSPHE